MAFLVGVSLPRMLLITPTPCVQRLRLSMVRARRW